MSALQPPLAHQDASTAAYNPRQLLACCPQPCPTRPSPTNNQHPPPAAAQAKRQASLLKARLGRALVLNEYEQLLASSVLNPHHIDVSLDDIGGLEAVKRDMVGDAGAAGFYCAFRSKMRCRLNCKSHSTIRCRLYCVMHSRICCKCHSK